MITFELLGEMPSKKNRWKVGRGGKVYIPPEIQVELDDFLWQLKAIKGRERLVCITGPVEVICHFSFRRDADLDNITTTLLDLLQKSGFIKNDMNVQVITASKKGNKVNHPFVKVTIQEILLD